MASDCWICREPPAFLAICAPAPRSQQYQDPAWKGFVAIPCHAGSWECAIQVCEGAVLSR